MRTEGRLFAGQLVSQGSYADVQQDVALIQPRKARRVILAF